MRAGRPLFVQNGLQKMREPYILCLEEVLVWGLPTGGSEDGLRSTLVNFSVNRKKGFYTSSPPKKNEGITVELFSYQEAKKFDLLLKI
jgi:hypothetical protein